MSFLSLMHSAANVKLGPREQRPLLYAAVPSSWISQDLLHHDRTGMHAVADVFCLGCNERLGWYYHEAQDNNQKYKEGGFHVLGFQLVIDCVVISSQASISWSAKNWWKRMHGNWMNDTPWNLPRRQFRATYSSPCNKCNITNSVYCAVWSSGLRYRNVETFSSQT